MSFRNVSVEASILQNGKLFRGTLTLFNDEYVFGSIRRIVNWEQVICEYGTVPVKTLIRNIEKDYIVFNCNGIRSEAFILEPQQKSIIIATVKEFSDNTRRARITKELQKKQEAEEAEARRQQLEQEQRIRVEAKRKTEEEFRKKQEYEQQKKAEEERQLRLKTKQVAAEKEARINAIIEGVSSKPLSEKIRISDISKKAGKYFLNNPYRVLGISCTSNNEEVNNALDKIKKLARLNALNSYKSSYDLEGIEKPVRDISVAQNSLSLLKNIENKWFWFSSFIACNVWSIGKYRIELEKDGFEYGSYDLFIANYLYAVLCDADFNVSETWKRVLRYYCFICDGNQFSILQTRFNEKELLTIDNSRLMESFKKAIFNPILDLCDRDDLDAIIRLNQIIKECNNKSLDDLCLKIVTKLLKWFTDKELDMMRFLKKYDDINEQSDDFCMEIRKRGEEYCEIVEPVFEIVLRDFRGDLIRYNMIKESYKKVTYQLMFTLYKLNDKTNAILFANKCYTYCKQEDKERIKNTFGEVNIKAIDWNTPHTLWDIKGDNYYYGRGCAVDYNQALYWYHKAADAGNMYSKYSIGICYQKGNGVPQDQIMAAEWFKRACESGNPDGAFSLAECYFNGFGVLKNIDQALEYWDKASKLGHLSAQKRYDEVFASVQTERQKHRATNHVCHDLGFQMITGPKLIVEVSLNKPSFVYLVNAQGYQNYLNGSNFTFSGGHTTDSVYKILIQSSGHWYVIVDCGDDSIEGLKSSVKVRSPLKV